MSRLRNNFLIVALAALLMSGNTDGTLLRLRDDDDFSGSILDLTSDFKAKAAPPSSGSAPAAAPAEKHPDTDSSGSVDPKDGQTATPAKQAAPTASSEAQTTNGEAEGAQADAA